MTSYLEHHLVNGYIHNWLVAGPRVLAVQPGKAADLSLAGLYQQLPEAARTATLDASVEPQEMTEVEVGGEQVSWRYLRCLDDHLIDLSATYPLWKYLSAWAYTVVKLPVDQTAAFVVTANGPVDVWVNGAHVHRQDGFSTSELTSARAAVALHAGENQIMLRFEMLGVGACPFSLALRVVDLAEEAERDAQVLVPTEARFPRRHEIVEETFEKAYLEEVVNHRGAHFNLRWAEDKGYTMKYAYQVQDKEGLCYVEGHWETDHEKPYDAGHTFRLNERPLYVVLRPILIEYFEHNLRYEKKLPIYVIDNEYATTPSGSLGERNREALEDAVKHNSLFAEAAKLKLGRWDDFKPDVVLESIQKVNRREVGSEALLMGLLGIMYRAMNDPKFPERLKKPLQACVLNFQYGPGEGTAAQPGENGLNFTGESERLLSHACGVLAGQLFPRHTFVNSGKKGAWQRKEGERLAIDWLRQRGTQGYQDWDSNDSFATNLMALSHLTSLSEDLAVRELSAVMMDKTFFSMAVNSYKGAFGSSHGRSSASMLKSAQLEATSGISRMMWGTGVYNSHIQGTVSLAASNYDFPLLLGDIANDAPAKMWSRERSVIDAASGAEVNRVTYKTPDYMLSSAQDYRPGQRGGLEHIWQATLGPDAPVFVNHPSTLNGEEEHLPGFWLGNRSLPRVAQWKDVLVAAYHLPENDWLGFTHAYFPTYQFSEYEIVSQAATGHTWAFARKDHGYLALSASQGFNLSWRAPDGYRELRSFGQNNIWLCHMGRAETDGDFVKFKKRILAMKVEFEGLGVRCKTLRGEYLSFGWEAPLQINSKEIPLRGFKHHESPYSVAELPATQMDINSNGTVMRLDFS
jgi:hypothetical protein